MKSVRLALLATVISLSIGGAETSEAAIFDYSYKFDSTGSTFGALFEGDFRSDNNIFDITGVNSITVNGSRVSDDFSIYGYSQPNGYVSLNGFEQDFALNSRSSGVILAKVTNNSGFVAGTSGLGGPNDFESYNPSNFGGRAGGPGAPAPEVGVGLLSMLAAGLALAFTRFRRLGDPLPA